MALKHVERLIRKIHLNNDGTADVSWRDYYTDDAGNRSMNKVNRDSADKHDGKLIIHEDFKNAFRILDQHWLIRGEEVTEPKATYPFDGSLKGLERTTVTSITYSGGEPTENGEERQPLGVHIQGTLKLKGGGAKNFCLPPIKPNTPQEKYKFATHLDQHLAKLEAEAWAYVAGEKFTAPPQQAMDFPGEGTAPASDDINNIGASTDDEEAPPAPPAPVGTDEETDEDGK